VEELKDIKGIIEVPDYSLWILISIIVTIIFFIAITIYFFKNRRKKRKKLTLKQIAMKNLKEIDFNDTKDTVYAFCENFQYFIDEKNKESFEELQKELEMYKYKKEIEKISKELEDRIKSMIKEIK
jgi:flagellar biosynthesis/type III secretory pathway M-ring protein FliF/YscJ